MRQLLCLLYLQCSEIIFESPLLSPFKKVSCCRTDTDLNPARPDALWNAFTRAFSTQLPSDRRGVKSSDSTVHFYSVAI
jgi:hypothetical protein